MKRAILIVLDGVGCGSAPDSAAYGDEGANTLGHVVRRAAPDLENLTRLGLSNLPDCGMEPNPGFIGGWGRLTEISAGKDTTTGHWEMSGLPVKQAFPTFPDGFPGDLMASFTAAVGRGALGNRVASGTEIIEALGPEHMRTGEPIVYTSADSVFQIAAHEDVIPVPELWAMCETARGLLTGPYAVGRVIARPFIGTPGAFRRTGNRRDFSIAPPGDTMLDVLSRAGREVIGVGKIEDIFAHRGLTLSDHASGNRACIESTLGMLEKEFDGLLFVNLVDFDSEFGHRNDVEGFARALEEVDRAVPGILTAMGDEDLLIFTADHGCDPAFPGTDHTREYVPLLCYRRGMRPVALGTRGTYADIAATILEMFDLPNTLTGTSFYSSIVKEA